METVKVRYIGKKYSRWWGDKVYEAKPRYERGKARTPVMWRIIDSDGDSYPIADGTIEEGLTKDWIVVS